MEYEVMVEIKARKYYLIGDVKKGKDAIELAKQYFQAEWKRIEDELQKLYGISLDEEPSDLIITKVNDI